MVSQKGFNARHLPGQCVYDMGGPCILPGKLNVFYLLGLYNSSLINIFLKLINPTINFPLGDIGRIPYKTPSPDIERHISALAQQCVNIKKDALQFVINDREFKQTAIQWGHNRITNEKRGEII